MFDAPIPYHFIGTNHTDERYRSCGGNQGLREAAGKDI